MEIKLENIGKKYTNEWIFRHFDYFFKNNESYVILGKNGSGKSTLLNIISSFLQHSEGSIEYFTNNHLIKTENIYNYLCFTSPTSELIDEYSLTELLSFYYNLKKPLPGFSKQSIIDICDFDKERNKLISEFSSGMKQKLKLALCFFTNTELILLDEPCCYLDNDNISWYKNIIDKYRNGRTIIVSSNNNYNEFFFCTQKINIEDFRK